MIDVMSDAPAWAMRNAIDLQRGWDAAMRRKGCPTGASPMFEHGHELGRYTQLLNAWTNGDEGVGRMKFWREFAVFFFVVVIASAILGKLLELTVLEVYPTIDPIELYVRISLVLTCLTVLLGLVLFRR